MGLISPIDLFKTALKGDYAVGAFNVNNIETLRGIGEAAKACCAPLIFMFEKPEIEFFSPLNISRLVNLICEDLAIDAVLHLDHGEDFEICKTCVDNGFTSVMIDGSQFSLDENVSLTKQIVEYAHSKNVAVEAELGRLQGLVGDTQVDDTDAVLTDPDEAARFVKETGCDALAVAIGTSHGAYKFVGEPTLDFKRLETIQKRIPHVPLVLHGASSVPRIFVDECNVHGAKLANARGVPDRMLSQAAKMNICKVNTDTDLRLVFTTEIRKFLNRNPENIDPEAYLNEARAAIKKFVIEKMTILGSSGKV